MRLREFAPAGGGGSGNYFQALASAWYNGVFDTGSLQKGIKSQEDVERLLNRGIVCPDGKTRKLHIDYNSDFDGVEIYSDDYYEYGDHDDTIDSRTGQKWGPYDFMAFSDEDLSEGLNEFAPDDSGRWYTDDQMTDLVGDGWWQDMDISGANIGVLDAEVPKKYMIQQAQRWLKRQGHDVQVLNVRVNDDDCEWYIEGTFPKDLTEFAPDSNDGGGEDDALRNYAKMWWAGDESTQMQIERALAKMGWEIGEDEGGYDNGGVFVVRAGDINGDSYTSWAAEDLTEGLTEVDRRGFLKGLGAAAVAGAAGYKMGQPDTSKYKNPKIVFLIGYLHAAKEYMPQDEDTLEINTIIEDYLDSTNGNATDLYSGSGRFFSDVGRYNEQNNIGRPGYTEVFPDDVKQKKWITSQGKTALRQLKTLLQQSNESVEQGVAEGSEDPFGPQGRFVGDTGPAQITTTVARVQLKPGDKVLYKPTEQRARIEAMSRDGTQARIHIPSPMGGRTFNCKTSDLKALGALKEKSTSQAQFRTMAAAAHDPKFARKVGIKQSVAREFNKADKGQSYKSLPKRAD